MIRLATPGGLLACMAALAACGGSDPLPPNATIATLPTATQSTEHAPKPKGSMVTVSKQYCPEKTVETGTAQAEHSPVITSTVVYHQDHYTVDAKAQSGYRLKLLSPFPGGISDSAQRLSPGHWRAQVYLDNGTLQSVLICAEPN